MVCPGCGSEKEMAYSAFSNALICLEDNCGFELEMPLNEALQVIEATPELVCA